MRERYCILLLVMISVVIIWFVPRMILIYHLTRGIQEQASETESSVCNLDTNNEGEDNAQKI
jgi:hypothetical protein